MATMTPLSDPISIFAAAKPATAPHVKILIVGDLARWKVMGRLDDHRAEYAFVDLDDLHNQTIVDQAPDLVLSPLVTPAFDAIDVAKRLSDTKFEGRYCAVANDVPNVDIIRREVKSIAPKLSFDLLILPTISAANSD